MRDHRDARRQGRACRHRIEPLHDRGRGETLGLRRHLRARLGQDRQGASGPAELRITAARNEILGELTQVFKDYTSAQEAVRRYENEILPAAQKSLDQTNDGYKNNKFSYLDVLDAQRTLSDTRAGCLTALRDLIQAAADLERLVGGKFQ
ncbi:MAG: TolC family protein [Planctomycetes bacterium]|nr:TolC family protein [Planctomycetota bacterium]